MKNGDERIEKRSNALLAKLLYLMLLLQVIVLAAKICLGGAAYCLLDGLALLTGAGATAVLLTVKGVWKAGDEALREIRQACLAKAFYAMMTVLVIGEFILIMADEENAAWYVPSLIVWGPPALLYTVLAVKNGLFQWGGKNAETTGKAKLARATALGALFFGVVMGGPACFRDGAFEPLGIVKIIGMGATWGLLFYAMFALLLKAGGKRADKELAAAEEATADEE